MKVLVRAKVGEISKKEKWFSKPICQELTKRGVEFGFQIKNSVEGLTKLDYPFGVHLPGSFADRWQQEGEIIRGDLLRLLESISVMQPQPLYVVLHGLRVNMDKPSLGEASSYISEVSAFDYLSAFGRIIKLVKELLSLGIPVALENVAFTNFYKDSQGVWQPKTHLDLRIPTLAEDMNIIQEETKCQLVLDVEHLAFALNFANRMFNYEELALYDPPLGVFPEDSEVWYKHHIFVSSGKVLVICPPAGYPRFWLFDEVKKVRASIFHLSGTQSASCWWQEIKEVEGKEAVGSHDIIREDDPALNWIIGFILQKEDWIVVPEVSGPDVNPCHWERLINTEEQSLETLCCLINKELAELPGK